MVERETHQFGRREFLTGAVAGSFAVTAMAGRTSAQAAWAGSAESRHARQRPVETASRQQSSKTPATLEGAVTTAPEPLENGVLVGAGSRVFLVDLDTGDLHWERLYRIVAVTAAVTAPRNGVRSTAVASDISPSAGAVTSPRWSRSLARAGNSRWSNPTSQVTNSPSRPVRPRNSET